MSGPFIPHWNLACRLLDVLAALRDATRSRHALIDSAMPLAMDAPGPRDDRLYLQRIAAWLADA
ncbi:hypothetical protein [Paraburkholderia sp. Tr-20389]|uniref:hypothetical protein n=1 Tax=Paraburkholderia sp. Tr-20389 TaxID=2703903 RepID=UPI001F11EE62|nr:hypothetical protein [Paraburkholderia sp. Tr-20389]